MGSRRRVEVRRRATFNETARSEVRGVLTFFLMRKQSRVEFERLLNSSPKFTPHIKVASPFPLFKLYEEDLEIHSLVKQNETRLERLFT